MNDEPPDERRRRRPVDSHRGVGQRAGGTADEPPRGVVWIGGAILGYVGGETILDDDVIDRRLRPGGALRLALPIARAAGVGALGWAATKPRTGAIVRDAPHSGP